MKKRGGLFITIEGPNGVGKTSLMNSLFLKMKSYGLTVTKTKEPTNSPIGRFVRKNENKYRGMTLALLVAADRYYHIEKRIIPYLKGHKIVLCDRYVESSLVLQRLDGLKMSYIWALNSKIIIPDLSFVLTADPKILEMRLKRRAKFSRFEVTRTREEELIYYKEAARYLANKGFKVILLDNGQKSLNENVSRILKYIGV